MDDRKLMRKESYHMDKHADIKNNLLECAEQDTDIKAVVVIVRKLKSCFAHYDKDDIKDALMVTHKLFDRLAQTVAEILGYAYPYEAEKCAQKYINR